MSQDSGCISTFFDSDQNTSSSLDRLSLSSFASLETSQDVSQTSTDSISDLNLSQLTIDEPEPLNIQPFYNLTPRPLPQSPHYVIEEDFSSNPWALLVATIFLTKTSGKTARPYMRKFYEEYPTPYHVLNDPPATFEKYFENLGLKKRGRMIWKLSYQFVSAKWRRASDLCGIGKYGEDAYRIFCLGHTDVDPSDRYLRLYIDWLRKHTEFMEDNSVTDSEHVIEDPVLNYYRITLRNCV
ncbi:methyl-CpG-binding domain protein 4-like isoform X2 [Nymphalis io]|nr:methyl-CpG-binding domain protein 4-like isoform X2 [Nymphalis io]XP_050353087.1 methyl-CpG-binding domain protein 4-like isoform X2 [Nymphalis io]